MLRAAFAGQQYTYGKNKGRQALHPMQIIKKNHLSDKQSWVKRQHKNLPFLGDIPRDGRMVVLDQNSLKNKMMKKQIIPMACLLCAGYLHAQVINPAQAGKDAATNHANNNISNAADNGVSKAENAIKGIFKKKKNNNGNNQQSTNNNTNNADNADQTSSTGSPAATSSIKSYQNYDFIPGDKILFEDHFEGDQDGEFPAHWELDKGQAVLNKIEGTEALTLTEGNYVYVAPRMKTASYLTDPFTVEYDDYMPCSETDGCAYGLTLFFKTAGSSNDYDALVTVSSYEAGYENSIEGKNFRMNSALPDAVKDDNFKRRWHHIAIAYKNSQLKVYVDQYRVLVVPDIKMTPVSLRFGGIGNQNAPMVLANVRIASGGNMNMIGKRFTESKIVTHGINFDTDKATIKPESMGTLNMIVQVMKDNPDIKFEVDGHTDNTGTAAHNLTLSQQRSDAVKNQLVKMGIDASRLTSKGFGDTKPVSGNNTLEGKANNRRVEFIKM